MGPRKQRDHGPDQVPDQGTAKGDDALVMATNNSSIVSKRSVERLYYPAEPHFFRFFVNKFQRRAPLINRGYHLRLHVVDRTLCNFLRQPSPKTKVIVNLGCGSDVIPWQCWTRYPQECTNSRAVFVDIDFPVLIRRKRHTVLSTPELESHLSHVRASDADAHIFLRSDRYYQVGCDLRQTAALGEALASIVDVRDCLFIFIAEVSITYMKTDAADSVIQWASTLGQGVWTPGRTGPLPSPGTLNVLMEMFSSLSLDPLPNTEFCLLEQILPDGPDHPFASTMTGHFEKLSTPIKSVTTYPTIPQQHARFRNRGWSKIRAQSLWSAWNDDTFFSPDDRRKIDHIEPFDEWEEFALFGSHYVLLHARNYGNEDSDLSPSSPVSQTTTTEVETRYKKLTGRGPRRFGAAMIAADALGQESIINCLGLGSSARRPSYDVYTREGLSSIPHLQFQGGPSSRMCFTLTDLGHHGVLLAGGRSSPAKAMDDCWLFKKDSQRWERIPNLPIPLYRHSISRLTGSSLALVLGGRSGDTGLSDLAIVYHPQKGWLECRRGGAVQPEPVFGAILTCCGRKPERHPIFHGFLAGGLSSDGVVVEQVLAWSLSFEHDTVPTITFYPLENIGAETSALVSKFGAAYIQEGDSLILLGGVGCDGITRREDDMVVFSTSEAEIRIATRLAIPASDAPRPLLIGSSVVLTEDRQLVVIGGAATCFSMGTFWTKGVYTLRLPQANLYGRTGRELGWELSCSGEIVQMPSERVQEAQNYHDRAAEVKSVRRIPLHSKESFEKITADGRPVILEGLDLGPCLTKWNLDYLVKQIGSNRKVVVHEAQSKTMDFNAKNFRYTTMTFSDFAKGLQDGRRLYLRALSADAPADQAASLNQDFPLLASDFVLPGQLDACERNMHSSILRISGLVNMWLHYDVQANVYCQINGSKRMILFPPSDVNSLSLAPGSSSSSVDVFESHKSPALRSTHPLEADLHPGDVLYLPPLWLHTAEPTTNISIAVNVFFRSLDSAHYATGRDVYGNRDLAAYDKGRKEIGRLVNGFDKVPGPYKQFYLLRLAEELTEMARNPGF